MLLSFFTILPREPLQASSGHPSGYEAVDEEEEDASDHDQEPQTNAEHETLLASSMQPASGRNFSPTCSKKRLSPAVVGFRANLRRAKGLFFP